MAVACSISPASRRTKRRLSNTQLVVRRALATGLDREEARRVVAAGIAAGTMKYPAQATAPARKGVA